MVQPAGPRQGEGQGHRRASAHKAGDLAADRTAEQPGCDVGKEDYAPRARAHGAERADVREVPSMSVQLHAATPYPCATEE